MGTLIKNGTEFAHGLLQDALDGGARAIAGGQAEAAGRYIAPTLVTDVDKDSRLMTEEIFGPVLPVIGFRNLQEAVDHLGDLTW